MSACTRCRKSEVQGLGRVHISAMALAVSANNFLQLQRNRIWKRFTRVLMMDPSVNRSEKRSISKGRAAFFSLCNETNSGGVSPKSFCFNKIRDGSLKSSFLNLVCLFGRVIHYWNKITAHNVLKSYSLKCKEVYKTKTRTKSYHCSFPLCIVFAAMLRSALGGNTALIL